MPAHGWKVAQPCLKIRRVLLCQVSPRWLMKFCTSCGCEHTGLLHGLTPAAVQLGNGTSVSALPCWQYDSGFIQSYLYVLFDVCVTWCVICSMRGLWGVKLEALHHSDPLRKETLWYSCSTCSFHVFLLDDENGPSYLKTSARRAILSTPKMFPFIIFRLNSVSKPTYVSIPASSMHVKIYHLLISVAQQSWVLPVWWTSLEQQGMKPQHIFSPWHCWSFTADPTHLPWDALLVQHGLWAVVWVGAPLFWGWNWRTTWLKEYLLRL